MGDDIIEGRLKIHSVPVASLSLDLGSHVENQESHHFSEFGSSLDTTDCFHGDGVSHYNSENMPVLWLSRITYKGRIFLFPLSEGDRDYFFFLSKDFLSSFTNSTKL